MNGPFVVELRRGVGKWLAVPLVVVGYHTVHKNIPPHGYSWAQTVYALGQAGLLLGPLAAGFGAWAGTRARRRGMLAVEALSVQGPVRPGLVELAALIVWTAAAYAAVVALVFAQTASQTHGSGPALGRTTAGLFGVALQLTVGYAAGRLVAYRLVPLVVAYGLFTVVQAVNSSQHFNTLNLFLPDNLQLFDFYDRLITRVPYLQIAWYLALSGLVLSIWAVWRLRSGPAVGVVALATAATLLAGFGVSSLHGRENRPGTFVTFTCDGRVPKICLHPSLVQADNQVAERVGPIVGRLTGTPFAIHVLEQRPRGVGGVPSPGAVAFHLDDDGPGSLGLVAGDVAGSVFNPIDQCLTPGTGELRPGVPVDAPDVIGALAQRLLNGPAAASTPGDSSPRGVLARLGDDEFRAFVTSHARAIRSCTLEPSAVV